MSYVGIKPIGLSLYESVCNAASGLAYLVRPKPKRAAPVREKVKEVEPSLMVLHSRLCADYALEEHAYLNRKQGSTARMPEQFALVTVRLLSGYANEIFADIPMSDEDIKGDPEAERFNLIGSLDQAQVFQRTIEERVKQYGAKVEIGCGLLRRTGRTTSIDLPEYTAWPTKESIYTLDCRRPVEAQAALAESLESKVETTRSARIQKINVAQHVAA